MRRIIVLEMNGSGPDMMFDCPGCGNSHGVWTKKPNKQNARWKWNGSVSKPTFTPSILIKGGPTVCHSFIKDGMIQYLNDCTHHLVGKTVELPEID